MRENENYILSSDECATRNSAEGEGRVQICKRKKKTRDKPMYVKLDTITSKKLIML